MNDSEKSLQDELLRILSKDMKAGNIGVASSDANVFSQLKARFPVRTSGIAWEMVPGYRYRFSPDPKISIEHYLPTVRKFLEQFAADAHIAPTDVVFVVGDGVTDVSFSMPF